MTPDPIDIDVTTERRQREALAHLNRSLDLLTRNSSVWARLPDLFIDLWDDTEILEGCCEAAVRLKREVDEISARIPHAHDESAFIKCLEAISAANGRGKTTFMSKMFVGLNERGEVYQERGLNYFSSLLVGYGDLSERLEGILTVQPEYHLPGEAISHLDHLKSQCQAKIDELTSLRDGMITTRDFSDFPRNVAERHGELWKTTQKFIEDAMSHHSVSLVMENATMRRL